VIQQQKVDALSPDNPDHADPYLFTVMARVKDQADVEAVKQRILETCSGFKDQLVPPERLDAVKRHLRYSFALGMDNSEAIARTLAHYIALRRTPETINKVYDLYQSVTPEDIRRVARKYFSENGRTIVTLSGKKAQ
jgi:zinc protease